MKSSLPSELGYGMPAEWQPHAATWLSWPKDPETWPDRVPQVQEIFLRMIETLSPHETVNVLVDNNQIAQEVLQRCRPSARGGVRLRSIPTVDSWIRDYGPNFLISNDAGLAYNDWIFNAWGNKYEELKRDSDIPKRLEPVLQIPRFEPGIVMEGGSIEVDGRGCVLTTEQCLLNPNRNPQLTPSEIEQYLKVYLGAAKVLWLGEGIEGDDTDGHIDDIARFVAPGVILCAVEEDPLDANFKPLQENLERLRRLTDTNDRPFEIVTLPMPGVVGGSSTSNRNLERLPASYANFYIANKVVLVPVFGHANDEKALNMITRLFPGRSVVGINCEPLVWGMGTIHCVTQQQPAI
jgi:agmatine deiminase